MLDQEAGQNMSNDLLRRCAACGIDFIWAIEEQDSGSAPPVSCPMCRRLAPATARKRGVIKWFNHSKGYGFITPHEGPEVFVHKAGLAAGQALPRAGQLVEFEPRNGARGVQAEEVVVLDVDVRTMVRLAPPESIRPPADEWECITSLVLHPRAGRHTPAPAAPSRNARQLFAAGAAGRVPATRRASNVISPAKSLYRQAECISAGISSG